MTDKIDSVVRDLKLIFNRPDPLTLAEMVVTVIKLKGWSKAEASKQIGVNPSTVSMLVFIHENGDDYSKKILEDNLSMRAAYEYLKEQVENA